MTAISSVMVIGLGVIKSFISIVETLLMVCIDYPMADWHSVEQLHIFLYRTCLALWNAKPLPNGLLLIIVKNSIGYDLFFEY